MENKFKKILVSLSLILVAVFVTLIIALPFNSIKGYKFDLFSANSIVDDVRNMELNMTSVVYAKDNNGKWVEYQRLHGDENRIWIDIEKIPKHLKNAIIAIEDEDFYSHKGIDLSRTFGAIANFIFKYDSVEFGGSTITQQLIKNITDDKGKNALRKVREIFRAILIETKLNKTEILEAYLNTIALGNGICGVEVAANNYFNKEVHELSLAECACIASITQNPSKYNPITGEKNNVKRRTAILNKMLELNMISSMEYLDAVNEKIVLDTSQMDTYEPDIHSYFVDTLIEQTINDLVQKYGFSEKTASSMIYNGGYKIYSTLNIDVQKEIDKVYSNTKRYFYENGKTATGGKAHVQSGMTVMDYSGHIVGISGGAGEKTVNRGLNRAYSVPRQPGSTMKPLGVYALSIEENLVHYSSKVKDAPIKKYYPDGKSGPRNAGGYYSGTVTLDYAIRKSLNTVPVRLLKEMGVEKSYDFLVNKLNMKYLINDDKNYSSLALGGCHYGITPTESAAAYAIFGNKGIYYKPTTYYKIENIQGEAILEYNNQGKNVISEESATIMNHLLQGVVYGSGGTGGRAAGYNYKMKAYAKTGTSSETNDVWFVGGTPYYVASVWYGHDFSQRISNSRGAVTIWRDVMKEIHNDLETKKFEDSEGVFKKGVGYYKKGTKPDNYTVYSSSSSEESSSSQVSSKPATSSSSSIISSSTSSTTSQEPIKQEVSENTTTQTTPPVTKPNGGVSDNSANNQSASEPSNVDTPKEEIPENQENPPLAEE